jgi:uncharacterized membrane protein
VIVGETAAVDVLSNVVGVLTAVGLLIYRGARLRRTHRFSKTRLLVGILACNVVFVVLHVLLLLAMGCSSVAEAMSVKSLLALAMASVLAGTFVLWVAEVGGPTRYLPLAQQLLDIKKKTGDGTRHISD